MPLESESIDVAIFCLSLMGVNWHEFIKEAYRVLRCKGKLLIAEVKSRLEEDGVGGITGFVNMVHALGFAIKKQVITVYTFYIFIK